MSDYDFERLLLGKRPQIQSKYYVALGTGNLNQYLIFILADLIFLICGVIYLASSLLVAWKENLWRINTKGRTSFLWADYFKITDYNQNHDIDLPYAGAFHFPVYCGTGIDWMGFWLSGYSFYV